MDRVVDQLRELVPALAFLFVWWMNRRMKADDARWKEKMRKKRGY